MGMFDTLVLNPPVTCPRCGKLHDETQTKRLSDTLSTWKVGRTIAFCPVTSGILKESVHCCRIDETDEWTSIPIFVVVWHGVYAGYALSEDEAQSLLNNTDRLDLLRWLQETQREAAEWRTRYRSLLSDLGEWQETRREPPEVDLEKRKRQRLFRHLPEEVVNDPDPLTRILERNAEDQPANTRSSFLELD